MSKECNECGTRRRESNMYKLEVYDTPWDSAPRTIYVCKETPQAVKKSLNRSWMESCEELLTDSSWADFRYFTCESCQRMICEQNPRNGWHQQYRTVNECEMICLQCYENDLYQNGLENEREKLEHGKLPGMFLNDSELLEHGYTKESDEFIRGTKQAAEIAKKILGMMESYRVLISYEHMSIVGDEGYISIWKKEKSE